MKSFPSEDGYTLTGFDPPGFERFPDDVHKMFYGWIVELGLRAKDRDLAKGLDKDGKPFHPIHPETKKYRRSAMTPSGKGDPNAPPLIPGWQKSRIRSLLTGKATATHAEFWWKYDSHTHDSFARILEYQRDNYGRDAFGLSLKAMTRVRAQAWERWDKWRKGKYQEPAERPRVEPGPVRAGSYRTKYLDLMGGAKEVKAGQHVGFMTPEEWEVYFRQSAKAVLPGRPLRPKVMSQISGPRYTRGLQHDWGRPASPPPPKQSVPSAPSPIAPKSLTVSFEERVMKAVRAVPVAKRWGPNAAYIHHVHEEYQKIPGAKKMTLAEFKEHIAAGPIRAEMHRADLVNEMDLSNVRASHTELKIGDQVAATYNFIRASNSMAPVFEPLDVTPPKPSPIYKAPSKAPKVKAVVPKNLIARVLGWIQGNQ